MKLRLEPTSMNAAKERVGLVFLDRPSLSEQIELARYAERQEFESVWVCETSWYETLLPRWRLSPPLQNVPS